MYLYITYLCNITNILNLSVVLSETKFQSEQRYAAPCVVNLIKNTGSESIMDISPCIVEIFGKNWVLKLTCYSLLGLSQWEVLEVKVLSNFFNWKKKNHMCSYTFHYVFLMDFINHFGLFLIDQTLHVLKHHKSPYSGGKPMPQLKCFNCFLYSKSLVSNIQCANPLIEGYTFIEGFMHKPFDWRIEC